MIRCPKCEADLMRGAARCPLCGTPQSAQALIPAFEPEPIVDPMLDLFQRDETVFVCPECENEFRDDQKRCRPCGIPLIKSRRRAYEERLLLRPIHDFGVRASKGPIDLRRDLVRVHVASSLQEAKSCVDELRALALEVTLGNDVLDTFDDAESIGIYVEKKDLMAAEYLLEGWKPAESSGLVPPKVRTAREIVCESAQAYLDAGKFKAALGLARDLGGEWDGVRIRALAHLAVGERQAAIRAIESALGGFLGKVRAEAGTLLALILSLAPDLFPFGKGADLVAARRTAEAACAASPRLLRAGKVCVEILAAGGDRALACKELDRLATINPNILGRDGFWRDFRRSA